MTNQLFISRCATILATMRGGGFNSVTTKQIAQWLNMEEAAASQVIAKACKFNILQKVGAAAKTKYQLSKDCHNNLESKCTTMGINEAAKYVAEWFINYSSKRSIKKVTTVNGKTYTKVESQEELDAESKQAVDSIILIINENKDLKAENELLKEEIEKLKPYKEYYEKVKSVKI